MHEYLLAKHSKVLQLFNIQNSVPLKSAKPYSTNTHGEAKPMWAGRKSKTNKYGKLYISTNKGNN